MQSTDLMERPSSRAGLASWYAAILEDQEASGMSVAAYADEVGVSAATLYQWRRRLEGEDGAQQSANSDSPDPDLIEVLLATQPEAPLRSLDSTGLTVHLGGSRRIEVPQNFDADELKRLVRVLESC